MPNNKTTRKSLMDIKGELIRISRRLEKEGNEFGIYQDPKNVSKRIIHDLNHFIDFTIRGMIEMDKALNTLQSRKHAFKQAFKTGKLMSVYTTRSRKAA